MTGNPEASLELLKGAPEHKKTGAKKAPVLKSIS